MQNGERGESDALEVRRDARARRLSRQGLPTEREERQMTQIDQAKLEQFAGQAVGDMAAAISGLLVHIGDQLGLYRAMAAAGPVTPARLAEVTGTAERYVREWLGNQAAGGYVTYRPEDGTFELPAEHAAVLADENSPVFLGGAYEGIAACYSDYAQLIDAFRTGRGVGWEQ